jgi:hypothetical protein
MKGARFFLDHQEKKEISIREVQELSKKYEKILFVGPYLSDTGLKLLENTEFECPIPDWTH